MNGKIHPSLTLAHSHISEFTSNQNSINSQMKKSLTALADHQ